MEITTAQSGLFSGSFSGRRTDQLTCVAILLLFLAASTPAIAAGAQPAWVRTYPACGSCEGYAVFPLPDGGYIIAGSVLKGAAGPQQLVLKTDPSGDEQWRVAGTGSSCTGRAASIGGDGNIRIAGGGCTGGSGGALLTSMETAKGTVLAAAEYDTGRNASASALLRAGDSGYLLLTDAETTVAGRTDRDIGIYRIRPDGTVIWSRAFSGPYDDTGPSATEADDGSLIITATTGTGDNGSSDIVLVGLGPAGEDRFAVTVGRNDDERAAGVVPAAGGGFIIAGTSCSRDRARNCDLYAAGTDRDGRILWDRQYGGSGREYAAAVLATPDGEYIIAGSTDSPELGADGRDIRLIRISENGRETWNSTFGTAAYEYITGAALDPDGALLLTGYTTSPVDSGTHTLFLIHAGADGRDIPSELSMYPQKGSGNGGITVSVRDAATGAGIPDASVYRDGRHSGKTSAAQGSFVTGITDRKQHTLRITKEGYREQTVRADGTRDITVSLQPSPIHRIAGAGTPETSLDIVFIPSNTSYDCTKHRIVQDARYLNTPDAFLADVRRLTANRLLAISAYSTVPGAVPANYRERLNIWYYWDGFSFADAFAGCAGTLPAGFYDEAPYTDAAIILYPEYIGSDNSGTCEPVGCTSSPGPGPQVYFKVAADQETIFLHESGHAIFGLMDTYCGTTYYEENQPSANVWGSNASCIADARKNGRDAALCRPIAGSAGTGSPACSTGFYRYDPDPDLMGSTGLAARFGDAAFRRIAYVLTAVRGG